MTTMADFEVTDDVTDNTATRHNRILGNLLRSEFYNPETLAATRELSDGDTPIQVITLTGDQTIELPPEATSNHPFLIYNTDATETLTVKDDAGAITYATLTPDQYGYFVQVQGEGWKNLYTQPASLKGRVEILANIPPTTVAATLNALVGASSPAEQFTYWEFVNGSVTYMDFLCRLIGYNGGGLTISGQVMRTTGAAAATYIFEAAIRRINNASEDLGAAHTYDYNPVTVTIPAGPPAAGIPMAITITFTNGADMDSLADNEYFYLRFRRNGGTATDTARVLTGLTGKET